MQRLTISLPDDLAADLRRKAQLCRKSLSEVVRDALVEHEAKADATAPMLPFVGIVKAGGFRSIEEMDAELEAHWPEAIKRGSAG